MTVRGLVTHVKTVPAGATVGYGATWRAERETRVATVAMGYADGVLRAWGGRGEVLVRGRRAPLIGRGGLAAARSAGGAARGGGGGAAVPFSGAAGGGRSAAEGGPTGPGPTPMGGAAPWGGG